MIVTEDTTTERLSGIDAVGDVRAVSVLRILLGPIVLVHLEPFLTLWRQDVVYSDRFTEPYFDAFPLAGRDLYVALLLLAVPASVAMGVGLFTRWSAGYTAAFVAYNLFLSTTHYSHNRAFLLVLLLGVTVLPTGRYYSVDAWLGTRRGRLPDRSPTPLWPLWLLRFEVVVVYLASGFSKLIDPDWWGGRVLALRAEQVRARSVDSGVPEWLMDVVADTGFQWWFSKVAVLTELAIGFGLLFRRSRLAAIWLAIGFHVAIEIIFEVQVFSWAALAALVIWVTPTIVRRTLQVSPGHWLATWVPRLDWFGRFDLVADSGADTTEVAVGRVRVIDRRIDPPLVIEGGAATRFALSRLPVTFWFAYPALVWAAPSRRRARPSG